MRVLRVNRLRLNVHKNVKYENICLLEKWGVGKVELTIDGKLTFIGCDREFIFNFMMFSFVK